MIQSKKDYHYYLECDRVALKIKRKRPPLLKIAGYETWRFEHMMRTLEYYVNCKKNPFIRKYLRFRYHQLQVKCGFQIPIITIANHCAIGANAVVVKSITEEGTTWGGVLAKMISTHSSSTNLVNTTEIADNYMDKSCNSRGGGNSFIPFPRFPSNRSGRQIVRA